MLSDLGVKDLMNCQVNDSTCSDVGHMITETSHAASSAYLRWSILASPFWMSLSSFSMACSALAMLSCSTACAALTSSSSCCTALSRLAASSLDLHHDVSLGWQ